MKSFQSPLADSDEPVERARAAKFGPSDYALCMRLEARALDRKGRTSDAQARRQIELRFSSHCELLMFDYWLILIFIRHQHKPDEYKSNGSQKKQAY